MLLLLLGFGVFEQQVVEAATTQYSYDDRGRIVQAVGSDGGVIQYQYDANGNITAINRVTSSAVSVAGFAPTIGHVGASMTITGAGFSIVPAENIVTFSGSAQAVVTAASATSLTVTVPEGAVTGPISVAANGTSATSAMSYTVRMPAILTFSPLAVNAGGTVTLLGTNLHLVPGATVVRVGGVTATITSITNSQVKFTLGANTLHGAIQVVTPYGSAQSARHLIVGPQSANFVSTNVLTADGGSAAVDVTSPGKFGAFSFYGTAGQYLTVHVTSFQTTPAGGMGAYTLYSPTNAVLASPGNGSVSATSVSLHLPRLPVDGIYVIAFTSQSAFQLSAQLEINVHMQIDGGPIAVSTPQVGQIKRLTFSASAGEDLALALTNISTAPSGGRLWARIDMPNGDPWITLTCEPNTQPGCSTSLANAPRTGTYTIRISSGLGGVNSPPMTMSFTMTLSRHLSGNLVSDTPQTVSVDVPGRHTSLTFTATAGQTFALYLDSVTSPSAKLARIEIFRPNGTRLDWTETSADPATFNLRNLAAGVYTVTFSVRDAAAGSMQLRLASGMTGTLAGDGSSGTFASNVPGQVGYITFAATAGENLSLAITNLATVPSISSTWVRVDKPDGTNWTNIDCQRSKNPGCALELANAPNTGTYTVRVTPGMVTVSLTLTLSRHITESLAMNTPQDLSLDVPGQRVSLSFTATAGQTAALNIASLVTTPANKVVSISILRPNGTKTSTTTSTATTLSWPNLAAGIHKLEFSVADAATAHMQVTLQ